MKIDMKFKNVSLSVKRACGLMGIVLLCQMGLTDKVSAQNTLPYDTSYTFQHYVNKQVIFEGLPAAKNEIVFLGNSITEQGHWAELFKNKNIVNRGIGGDISFGVQARINTILDASPKMLFLMIGINDIGRLIPTDTIAQKIEEIIRTTKEQSPKTKIVLQSVLPINEKVIWYDYMKNKSDRIAELNDRLKDIARKDEIKYVDLYSRFADSNGQLKPELTYDGLHLKADGYLLWKDVFKEQKINL
ncbi:GDSL family lipase [Marinilabiliaceae bacterium JC017]|nr:GDSL family lipase [Marinilabiliaceae bacterium JC017]